MLGSVALLEVAGALERACQVLQFTCFTSTKVQILTAVGGAWQAFAFSWQDMLYLLY
jgi:hypothetical protein